MSYQLHFKVLLRALLLHCQGSYQVTESTVPNYTPSYSSDCSSSILSGQTKTCIITNTLQASQETATLIVKKQVINDNGGTLKASDFTYLYQGIFCGGWTGGGFTQFSEEDIVTTFNPEILCGWNIFELNVPEGYTVTQISADCHRTTTSPGATYTCTVTNDDIPSTTP